MIVMLWSVAVDFRLAKKLFRENKKRCSHVFSVSVIEWFCTSIEMVSVRVFSALAKIQRKQSPRPFCGPPLRVTPGRPCSVHRWSMAEYRTLHRQSMPRGFRERVFLVGF